MPNLYHRAHSQRLWKSLDKLLEVKLNLQQIEDRSTPAIYTVTNIADTGAGSLRAANTSVNGDATPDSIQFNIAGAGVHTITPASARPAITNTVTIDGYSQRGSSANTLATGDNAVIEIEISGIEPANFDQEIEKSSEF